MRIIHVLLHFLLTLYRMSMPALMSAFNLFMSGSVGIMLMNLPEPPPEHMRYSASSSKPDLLAFARLLRPQTLPIVGGATDVAREHEGKSEGVGTMSSEGERRRERKKKEKGECWHVGVGAAVTTSCSVCMWGVLYHGARALAYVHARAHTEPGLGVASGLLLSVVH